MDMEHIQIPLHSINSRGQIIGKRGAVKLGKSQKSSRSPLSDNVFTIQEEQTAKEVIHQQPAEQHLFPQSFTEVTMAASPPDVHHVEDVLDRLQTDRTSMTQSIEALEIEIPSPVTTVVFEFQRVLCTDLNLKLSDGAQSASSAPSDSKVDTLTVIQKQLCFGGEYRIDVIKNFLKAIHRFNEPENVALNVKCFIIAKESSKTIVKLLKAVGILKYFVSASAMNPHKFVSHVMGRDHKIFVEAEGKRHLMLLKLMQFLQRSHDEMLYIGNNRDTVSHLNRIKICQTFLCQTKGLTEKAFAEIQESHFLS